MAHPVPTTVPLGLTLAYPANRGPAASDRGSGTGDSPRSARRVPMLWSIRVRLTLAALLVVVATLAVGGGALVWLLHSSLTDGLVSSATSEADNVGGLISQGPLPTDLPVRSGTAVQVVNASGVVVASSTDLRGRAPVAAVRPPVGVVVGVPAGVPLPGDDHNGITVATTVATSKGTFTIYAVSSRDQAEDSVHDLELALAIVLPILVVVSAVLVWILAGRALRPVESIRREVSDISVSDLHRRVPVPRSTTRSPGWPAP